MRTLRISNSNIKDFSIVLKAEPEAAEKTAAEFLQRVIKASCGAELPIVAEKPKRESTLASARREMR